MSGNPEATSTTPPDEPKSSMELVPYTATAEEDEREERRAKAAPDAGEAAADGADVDVDPVDENNESDDTFKNLREHLEAAGLERRIIVATMSILSSSEESLKRQALDSEKIPDSALDQILKLSGMRDIHVKMARLRQLGLPEAGSKGGGVSDEAFKALAKKGRNPDKAFEALLRLGFF